MSIIRSRADVSTLSDADLVSRVRSGDTEAYGVLWQRHARAGATVARSYTSSFDPDDLVSEAYAKIFQAIRSGGGPEGAFRPYLFTTIRNTAAAWGRARRETPIEDAETIEDPAFSEENSLNALDRSLTVTAFRTLPTRWQEALWYSEVEAMSPQEIAPLLGMKANAVAALTYRAREGLRQAWIQAHLKSVPADSECRWTIDRLGGYARKSLGKRDTARIEEHLQDCAKCTIVAGEAKDVGSRLALVLLPLAAGVAGATGYAAWMQTGAHTATYALGAGGVIMPAAAYGSAAGGAASGGSAGSSGAAGGTAGAASGAASGAGMGAIVIGASVIGAIVIGGVITAVALGPTLFGGGTRPHSSAQAAPPASAPSASAAPAPSASPHANTPPSPPPATTTTQTVQPAASVTSPETPSQPSGSGAPAAPGVGATSVSSDGTLTASGTGSPGNTVIASVDAPGGGRGTARGLVMPPSLASAAIRADGRWAMTADLTALPDGVYTLSFTQESRSGVLGGTVTRTVHLRVDTTPVVVSPTDGALLGQLPSAIAGTVAHADAVTVGVDGATPLRATVRGTVWSLPIASLPALTNGTHTITVTSTFRHRTTSTTITFRLGVPPIVTPPDAGATITTSTVQLAGTGIPRDTIHVQLRDDAANPIDGAPTATGVVGADGRWKATLDLSAMPDGDYTVAVTQTAPDGTVSIVTSTGIRFALAVAAPIVVSPTDGATLETAPASISGTVAFADTVRVSIDGGDPLTATLDADGGWHVDAPRLANGPHTITTVALYRGRTAEAAPVTFTLDAPPVITAPGPGALTTPDVVVTGTGGPGDTVTLEVQGSSMQQSAQTTVGADGAWTTTLDLSGFPNGDYRLSATQSGLNGAASPAAMATLSLRVPLAPPTITTVDTGDGRYYPVVSGTSAPRATIVVSDGSKAAVTTTADADGRWQSPQLTGFAAGTNTVTAYRTDGFVQSQPAAASFSLRTPDTTVDGLQSTDGALLFTIDVTGDAGATVQLLADHTPWYTTTLTSGEYTGAWQWMGPEAGSSHTLGARYASSDGSRFGPEAWTTVTVPAAERARLTARVTTGRALITPQR